MYNEYNSYYDKRAVRLSVRQSVTLIKRV